MDKLNLIDLSSDDPKIKYGCARNLLTVARKNPGEVYPHLDLFIGLLDSENKIIKWTAIDVIGYLARVDKTKKIDELMRKFFVLLNTGNLITANHAIATLTNIALVKPEHQKKITEELLKVEHYSYDTDECLNIAIGKVILAISSYFDQLDNRGATFEFVRRQTNNSRNATRKKAEQFLRRYRQQN
jgi:hypothetical protein